MKKNLENRRKSRINIFSNFIKQCVTAVLGIVLPRLILTNLGSESNGLLTSINNLLVYVALLEAGVGAASEQALFKPLGEDNHERINGIMSATAIFYRRTGFMYLIAVLVMSLVFPFTVNTTLAQCDVFLVVLLSGIPGVINYFFQGKFSVLLNSDGKSYIQTNLNTVVYIITSLSKILLLVYGFGIVAIQALSVLTNLIQVLFIEYYIHKHYKWLDVKSIPDYSEIKQSKNAFIHQIAWLVTSNTDVIVLTYFCGLKTVSVYSVYACIFNMIDGIVSSLPNGVHFALGQKFQTERNHYREIHDLYEITVLALCFSLFCVVAVFTNPFLKLYTEGVNDIKYVDSYLPFLFMVVHILVQGRTTSWETISVAGHFKNTQHQSIIEAIINIVSSLILVINFGIYGVLLGTVIASSYRVVAMIIYSRINIMHDKPWISFRRYFINIVIILFLILLLNRLIPFMLLNSYVAIVACASIAAIFIIFFFFALNYLFERNVVILLLDILKKRRT